jgi:phosphoribosylformimino-5-aminoimidazole carboxamide ribotide isomerase
VAQRFAIIPVLDLKGSEVVHARAGDRSQYRPIRTPLAAGSDADSVLNGLLALAPFRAVYIADLDAIERRGGHRSLIAALSRRHAQLEFWVDAGVVTASDAVALAADHVTPVIGSETLRSPAELATVTDRLGKQGCVLSLDYRGNCFVGPVGLDCAAELWPDRVIVMTLARVGSGAGPDITRLAQLTKLAGARQLFAAGGVRCGDDLAALVDLGVSGVLVASALHDGRLPRDVLSTFLGNR